MASIANRRMRLKQNLERAKQRDAALEDRIGRLMSQRVDVQEFQAELMQALSDLDELERNLPGG